MNLFLVRYSEDEKAEFAKFLNDNGFKMQRGEKVNLSNHCFPLAIDVKEKSVGLTSTYFLKDYVNEKGGEIISVDIFKLKLKKLPF